MAKRNSFRSRKSPSWLPAALVVLAAVLFIAVRGHERAASRLTPLEVVRNTAGMASLSPAADETSAPEDTVGESAPEETPEPGNTPGESTPGVSTPEPDIRYVLNTNTRKFHRPDCPSVKDIRQKNRQDFTGSRDEAIAMGYAPCKRCGP